MSSRLDELRRQRALLLEHLAWLERELAAENVRLGLPPAAKSGTPTASPSPPEVVPPSRPPGIGIGEPPQSTTASAADPIIATTINVVDPAAATAPKGPTSPSDAIFDQYRTAPDALRNDIRKGCLLYFALAFVLLGVGVCALYVLFRL